MSGPLLEKLQSKLTSPIGGKERRDVTDVVAKAIKVPAKPDRFAIWNAEAVVYVLSNPRYRHLLPSNTLAMQIEFLKPVAYTDKLKSRCSSPRFREMFDTWEARIFPGLTAHIVLRKRKIEENLRQALATTGIKQVVNFGAGYDTLFARLATEFPETTFFEVDLPSTQKPKVAMLRLKPSNLHFINLDFREPHLSKVMLAHPEYDKRQKTYFIAESSLHWIDEDDVERIFTFMAESSGHRSLFAFTFFDRGIDGYPTLPDTGILADLLTRIMRIRPEWGLKVDSLQRFLNDRFFGLQDLSTPMDLRSEAPEPIPPSPRIVRNDYLAFAELVYEG
jgi:methyltransferase (TIGR00027 family)